MQSLAAASAITLACAACSGDRSALGELAADAGPAEMNGRWMLAAPNAPSCGMNFSGSRTEGPVSPEGGCPGNFFMARRWTIEGGALVLRDENSEPLGRLLFAAGEFHGTASTGQQITLSR